MTEFSLLYVFLLRMWGKCCYIYS